MQHKGSVTGSTYFQMREVRSILSSEDEQIASNNRVLIFSRDPETRRLLATLLEMWGYQTEVSEALETSSAAAENQKPELILLDSVLPFAQHLETIRRIRRSQFLKEIPIIVLSGFSQPHFRSLSLAVGANDFFVKPLDFDALENYLKEIKQTKEKLH